MQDWKVPIVNRIGLPRLSEDTFNRAWDDSDDDTRKAIVDGNSAVADEVLTRTVFDIVGWEPVALPSIQGSDVDRCAAFMEFGNQAYIGLVTPELRDVYSGKKKGVKSPVERRQQAIAVAEFIKPFSTFASNAVLYGYNISEVVPEELDSTPPTGWQEQIKWLDDINKLYAKTHKPEPITQFRDVYACLSNFYPYSIPMDGLMYPSVENAFQAAKTVDTEKRKEFITVDASRAKQMGRRALLRPDWEQVKKGIMFKLLKRKFSPDSPLRKVLDETAGRTLIEGNTWHDNFWGDCSCARCAGIKGQNVLGQMLMHIRDKSKEG